MSNGEYNDIKNISIGDSVINRYGNSVNIIKVKKQKSFSQYIEIKTNLFYTNLVASIDTQFLSRNLDHFAKSTLRSCSFKDLIKDNNNINWNYLNNKDILFCPKKISYNYNQSEHQYLGNNKILFNYDIGYMFGTFLGDGCAYYGLDHKKTSHIGNVVWSFGVNEINIANKLKKIIKEQLNYNAIIKIKPYNKNIIKVFLNEINIAKDLNNWGKKNKKHLPSKFLNFSKDYISGIIDGLIDSDGTTSSNIKKFYNSSNKNIELFNVLFQKNNHYFPTNSKKKKQTGLLNCPLEHCNDMFVCQELKYPQKRIFRDYQISNNSIINKHELIGYAITTDCNENSFIANNLIVKGL